jgi:hypothetical protein
MHPLLLLLLLLQYAHDIIELVHINVSSDIHKLMSLAPQMSIKFCQFGIEKFLQELMHFPFRESRNM